MTGTASRASNRRIPKPNSHQISPPYQNIATTPLIKSNLPGTCTSHPGDKEIGQTRNQRSLNARTLRVSLLRSNLKRLTGSTLDAILIPLLLEPRCSSPLESQKANSIDARCDPKQLIRFPHRAQHATPSPSSIQLPLPSSVQSHFPLPSSHAVPPYPSNFRSRTHTLPQRA